VTTHLDDFSSKSSTTTVQVHDNLSEEIIMLDDSPKVRKAPNRSKNGGNDQSVKKRNLCVPNNSSPAAEDSSHTLEKTKCL